MIQTSFQKLNVMGSSSHATITAFGIVLLAQSQNLGHYVNSIDRIPPPQLNMMKDVGVLICPAASLEYCFYLSRFLQLVN